MNMKKTETCYNNVAQVLFDMIPEEWGKLVLYYENVNDSSTIYYYYYPLNSDKPVYWLDVNNIFIIDNKEQYEQINQLFDLFGEIYDDFISQKQERWTSLTYIIENRKVRISYSYEDISDMSILEIEEKWKAKNGIKE